MHKIIIIPNRNCLIYTIQDVSERGLVIRFKATFLWSNLIRLQAFSFNLCVDESVSQTAKWQVFVQKTIGILWHFWTKTYSLWHYNAPKLTLSRSSRLRVSSPSNGKFNSYGDTYSPLCILREQQIPLLPRVYLRMPAAQIKQNHHPESKQQNYTLNSPNDKFHAKFYVH